jgi:lipid A 3-O-deacylase
MRPIPGAIAAAGLIVACTRARAGEVFAGAFQHAAELHIAAGDEEKGVDAELGYRTEPLEHRILIGRPRVYGLLSKNSSGDTSFASVGLLWRRDFSSRLYGQFGMGLAIHDGAVDRADAHGARDKIVFGSRVLFEPELGLGWRVSRHWAIEASYVHISNGHIWTRVNPGMDDVGGRIVYRLGAP